MGWLYIKMTVSRAGCGYAFPSFAAFCALFPRSFALYPVTVSRNVLYALIVFCAVSLSTVGSIFVSSELEELLEVCHRIVVMRKGSVVGEVDPSGLPLDRLFAMCMED